MSYYRKIDFQEYKDLLNVKKKLNKEGSWTANPTLTREKDGTLVMPFIDEKTSVEDDLTYIGMLFNKATDGHCYKRQNCMILFRTEGAIEFSCNGYNPHKVIENFEKDDAIHIHSDVLRKFIVNNGKMLDIEMLVNPKLDPKDRKHVYD